MSSFLKIIFLLLLNILVVLLCAVWFSYLGLVDIKPIISLFTNGIFTPAMTAANIPIDTQLPFADRDDIFLLESERLSKKEQALDISFTNLKVEKEKIEEEKQSLIERLSEIGNIQKEYEDKEMSFDTKVKKYEERKANYRKISGDLSSITPDEAVKILSSHEDQDIIEIFRATDEIAKEKGSFSLVPTWTALMDPARMATIQRKMTTKPEL